MRKPRNVLSEGELRAFSGEHILYEISMLVQCGQLLTSTFKSQSATVAAVLRYAVIESFAIHVRNLVDFLYPTNERATDVLADDFFAGIHNLTRFTLWIVS